MTDFKLYKSAQNVKADIKLMIFIENYQLFKTQIWQDFFLNAFVAF